MTRGKTWKSAGAGAIPCRKVNLRAGMRAICMPASSASSSASIGPKGGVLLGVGGYGSSPPGTRCLGKFPASLFRGVCALCNKQQNRYGPWTPARYIIHNCDSPCWA